MAKTRSVFALILVPENKQLLLVQLSNEKGWKLPGGIVPPGEGDIPTLQREVWKQTGLTVEPLEQVAPPPPSQDEIAVAYTCRIDEGNLSPTLEAPRQRFVMRGDVRTRTRTSGRFRRMARMIWDGFSLMEEPVTSTSSGEPIEGIFVSDDGCSLVEDDGTECHTWPRLDPFSPTGKVEPKPT